jgi:hypothetical protein
VHNQHHEVQQGDNDHEHHENTSLLDTLARRGHFKQPQQQQGVTHNETFPKEAMTPVQPMTGRPKSSATRFTL